MSDDARIVVTVDAFDRASALLDRLRIELLRCRDAMGLPFQEEVPAGKRLVPTGVVTHCCGAHRRPHLAVDSDVNVPWHAVVRAIPTCCDPHDCGPCCPECPTCPTLQVARRAGSPTG